MSLYKYSVTTKKGILKFPIAATISKALPLDSRTTNYLLSSSQAATLRLNPNILAVERVPLIATSSNSNMSIHDIQNTGSFTTISNGAYAYETSSQITANFISGPYPYVSSVDTSSYQIDTMINIGLALHAQRSPLGFISKNQYMDGPFQSTNITPHNFTLDGTGVDIILSDPGFKPEHQDFMDSNGNSRLIEYDWNSELSLTTEMTGFILASASKWYSTGGYHGTTMASVCLGSLNGCAKGAAFYYIRTQLGDSVQTALGGNGCPLHNTFGV